MGQILRLPAPVSALPLFSQKEFSWMYSVMGVDVRSSYVVRCIIDSDKEMVGRFINGCKVLDENKLFLE